MSSPFDLSLWKDYIVEDRKRACLSLMVWGPVFLLGQSYYVWKYYVISITNIICFLYQYKKKNLLMFCNIKSKAKFKMKIEDIPTRPYDKKNIVSTWFQYSKIDHFQKINAHREANSDLYYKDYVVLDHKQKNEELKTKRRN